MDRQIWQVGVLLTGLCTASGCSQTSKSLVDDVDARRSFGRSSAIDDHADVADPPIVRRLSETSLTDLPESTVPEASGRPSALATRTATRRDVHQVGHTNVELTEPPEAAPKRRPARAQRTTMSGGTPASPFASGISRTMGRADLAPIPAATRLRAASADEPQSAVAQASAIDATPAARLFVSTSLVAVDGPTMSLAQIEAAAIERNPTIRQASAIAQKAIGTRQQVGLCPNPSIGYSGQEIGGDGTAGQQGMFVEQTFVRGNKLELNQNVADQEVQRLLWQVQVQRQRVLTDVRRQYYATLGAQLRMAMTEELEGLAADAADKFRLLFENAQGSRADQLQAEVLQSEISILRQQAANERDANWRQLANLMGSPEMQPINLAGDLEDGGAPREWDQSVAHLLSTSPQLQQAYADAQRAYASIRRAEVQKIPNVEMQASAAYFVANDNLGANLQVGLPIPFFNKNQGNVHSAWSDYHRAQNNVQRLRLSTQARLAQAFGDYRDAAIRVNMMQQEILPRQAESVELIEKGFGTQFDFLRLFTARRNYYESRVQYLNALVSLRQQEVLIDGLLLTGALDEVEDTVIDDSMRDAALDGR